ncbi:hypothetical protein CHS0354_021130 [Potamilus streckersoni]|uniref:Kringle domain-containing protein n=1 Tax=Potamilus streckersoni TaxID=2493646 RepID=A0AAE0T6U5_9BIVA|nr:hypothetical protein CHS0354_021130 [Potamilus streckersoni]
MLQQLDVVLSTITAFEDALDDCFIESYEYTGTRNCTEHGIVCMNWSSKSPHDHIKNDFIDGSIEKAENYCRDPDGTGQPWCYTVDPNIRYQNCTVPRCNTSN